MNYRAVCKGGGGFSTDVNYRAVCKGGVGFSTDVKPFRSIVCNFGSIFNANYFPRNACIQPHIRVYIVRSLYSIIVE